MINQSFGIERGRESKLTGRMIAYIPAIMAAFYVGIDADPISLVRAEGCVERTNEFPILTSHIGILNSRMVRAEHLPLQVAYMLRVSWIETRELKGTAYDTEVHPGGIEACPSR